MTYPVVGSALCRLRVNSVARPNCRCYYYWLRLVIVWAICALWGVSSASSTGQLAKRNLLMVFVRGLGAVIEPYGSLESSSTPRLRSFAENSTVFHRVYANSPNWQSSRVSLLSGTRMSENGVFSEWHGRSFRSSLQPQSDGPAQTLPQWFKSRGYVTQAVGEVFSAVHGQSSASVGCQSASTPTDGCQDDELSWSKSSTVAQPRLSVPCTQCLSNELSPETEAAVQETQCSDVCITDNWAATYAISQLTVLENDRAGPQTANMGKPWLLAVGLQMPAFPLVVPKAAVDESRSAGLPLAGGQPFGSPNEPNWPVDSPKVARSFNWDIRKYSDVSASVVNGTTTDGLVHGSLAISMRQAHQAAVTEVDGQIGRLLDALDGLGPGAANNTMVVVLGDSGTARGDRGAWRQQVLDEATLRTVMLIRETPQGPPCRESSNASSLCSAPGGQPSTPSSHGALEGLRSAVNGARTKALAELIDVWPTLAELLLPNETLPADLSGRSLVKAMRAPIQEDYPNSRRRSRQLLGAAGSPEPALLALRQAGQASAAFSARPSSLNAYPELLSHTAAGVEIGWPRPPERGLRYTHKPRSIRQELETSPGRCFKVGYGPHARRLFTLAGVPSQAVPALPVLAEPSGHRQTVFAMMPRDPFCASASSAEQCQTTGDPSAWDQGTGAVMGVSALSNTGWRLTEWVQYDFAQRQPAWSDIGTDGGGVASSSDGLGSDTTVELYDFRGDSGRESSLLGGINVAGQASNTALVQRMRTLLRSGPDSSNAFDPEYIPFLASDVVPTAAPTPTMTSSASPTFSASASPSPSLNASTTPSSSPSSANASITATPSNLSSATPSPSVTASHQSQAPSASVSATANATTSAASSAIASVTASASVSASVTASTSTSPSSSSSSSATASPTASVTSSSSALPTPNASEAVVITPTSSASASASPSPSVSVSASASQVFPSVSASSTPPVIASVNASPIIDINNNIPVEVGSSTAAALPDQQAPLSQAAIGGIAAVVVAVVLAAVVAVVRGGQIGPFRFRATGDGGDAGGSGDSSRIQRRKSDRGSSRRRKAAAAGGGGGDTSRQRRISRLAGTSGLTGTANGHEFSGLMASPMAADTAESANGRPLDVGIRVPSRSSQGGRGGATNWGSGGRAIATRTNPVAAAARARRSQSRRRSLSGGDHSAAARWSKAGGARGDMAASSTAGGWAGGRVV